MPKKNTRNTKGRIVAAAWKLFYEQGYEETTVEDIIFESETSKGSFYHYFDGKDALLSSLSVLFDERYEELMQQEHGDMDCIGLLCWLNYELFVTIDNTVSIELLSRLFSSQLVTKGERHLLSRNRTGHTSPIAFTVFFSISAIFHPPCLTISCSVSHKFRFLPAL